VDLGRAIIGLKKFKVRRVCQVLGISRSNQYQNKTSRSKFYKRREDQTVLKSVLEVTKTRGTDGYPRVTARINRERRKAFLPTWNEKRIYRVMAINKLLLPKRTLRRERPHTGKIIAMKSNVRYCSDIFQIQCWNGEAVNVAFSLDCCDREAMSFVAERRALFHEDIIKLIDQTVTKRFGDYIEKLPHEIQWLSDRGPQYTAENTKAYAREWGFKPITTPSYSPESNGMAEGFVKLFKRDYANVNDLWTAEAVLRQLPGWFADYNENHPHSGLKMRSPVEYRAAELEAATRSV